MKYEKIYYFLSVSIILFLTIQYYLYGNPSLKNSKHHFNNNKNSAIETIVLNETTAFVHHFCNIENCVENLKILFYNKSVICAFYNADPKIIEELAKEAANFKLFLDNSARNKSFTTNVSFISINSGIFHPKVCLIENITVIQSFNPTEKNAFYDINDQFIIYSENITKSLLKFFKEDYLKIKKPFRIITNNMIITNYDIEKLIIENINNNTKFMLYTLTLNSIRDALEKNKASGIRSTYNNPYTIFPNFTITFKNRVGQLHLKVFFNNNTVISGSYNPTKSATYRNYEISIIVKDQNLALKYLNFYNFLLELTKNENNPNKVKELIEKYNITITRKTVDIVIRNNKRYNPVNNPKGIYYISFIPVKEEK
ncbi:MAG: phospholipase D-like domain-containing protein [Candidatus Woesearchaeota archaeon]